MRNKIKNTLFAFAISLLFVACGGESPKDATTNFYEALKNGDIDTYYKYTTPTTQSLMNLSFAMICFDKDLKSEKELSSCMKKSFENLKEYKIVEIEENAERALVSVEEIHRDGNIKKANFDLIKDEKSWKISIKK